MGGIVELNTTEDSQPGFHGQVVISGGSFDTFGGFGQGQYAWGKNTFCLSASGDMTSHYLNPVVPENYTDYGHCRRFLGPLRARADVEGPVEHYPSA